MYASYCCSLIEVFCCWGFQVHCCSHKQYRQSIDWHPCTRQGPRSRLKTNVRNQACFTRLITASKPGSIAVLLTAVPVTLPPTAAYAPAATIPSSNNTEIRLGRAMLALILDDWPSPNTAGPANRRNGPLAGKRFLMIPENKFNRSSCVPPRLREPAAPHASSPPQCTAC